MITRDKNGRLERTYWVSWTRYFPRYGMSEGGTHCVQAPSLQVVLTKSQRILGSAWSITVRNEAGEKLVWGQDGKGNILRNVRGTC